MYLRFGKSIIVLAMLAGVAQADSAAEAASVWVVNSTADGGDVNVGDGVCASGGGACTLRAAIQEANALAGHDAIEFSIGSGVQTINLDSALPILTSPVTIDGTTQPGFSGAPLVVISGGGSVRGMEIVAGSSTLRGLAIVNFAGDGLELRDGGGNVLETNYVGMAADGTTAAGNSGSGIVLQGSSNNRIGGRDRTQRNLISGNTGKGNGGGILINGGSGNIIQGNFIGTDISGMLDRGNQGRGIALNGSTNNVIGGPDPGAGNLISGNRASGVRLLGGSHGNVVQGNYLGANRTLTGFIANDRGVQIRGSNENQVLGNVITGHVYDGVLIWEGSSNNLVHANQIGYNGQGPIGDPTEAAFTGVLVITGVGNKVLSNLIFGSGSIGIQLGTPLGVTPNDAGDGDTGGNNLQNYPTITSATRSGSTLTVIGTLNSTPNTGFLVQVFGAVQCDPSGHGEGGQFLGQTVVTTNAAGNASFTVVFGTPVTAGSVVSATATGASGTSEFSACRTVS